MGNTVNLEMVAKVMKYREKGLTLRDIAKLLEKDVKTVYRWYDFGTGRKKYISHTGKKEDDKGVDKSA
jgi:transposase-like protein